MHYRSKGSYGINNNSYIDYEHGSMYGNNSQIGGSEDKENIGEFLKYVTTIIWAFKWLILTLLTIFGVLGYALGNSFEKEFKAEAVIIFDGSRLANLSGDNLLGKIERSSVARRNQIQFINSYQFASSTAKLLFEKGEGERILSTLKANDQNKTPLENLFSDLRASANNYLQSVIGGDLDASDEQSSDLTKLTKIINQNVIANDNSIDRSTTSVAIVASAPVKWISILLTNTHADNYINRNASEILGLANLSYDALQKQLDGLKIQLDASKRESTEYKNKITVEIGYESSVLNNQLTTLSNSFLTKKNELNDAEIEFNSLSNIIKSNNDMVSYASTAKDQVLRNQYTALQKNKQQFELSSLRYGPKHPKIIDLVSKIALLEQSIRNEFDKKLRDAKINIQILKQKISEISNSVKDTEAKTALLRNYQIKLNDLEDSTKRYQSLYEKTFDKLTNLSTQKNDELTEARVLEYSRPDIVTSSNKNITFTFIGLGIGLFLSIIIVVFVLVFDDTFKSSLALNKLTGLKVIASVPMIKGRKAARVGIVKSIFLNDYSSVSESIRAGRVSINLLNKDTYPKSIGVSSTLSGEGKTVLSCALAVSYANSGRKTIIIDCDFRLPKVQQYLQYALKNNPDNMVGIEDYFSGNTEPLDHLQRTNIDNLSAITGKGFNNANGKKPDGITAGRIDDLFNWATSNYEVVIVDCPPVLAVSETRLVASRVDNMVYAVRWGRTRESMLYRSVDALKEANENIRLVMTMVDFKKAAKMDYYNEYRARSEYDKYYQES